MKKELQVIERSPGFIGSQRSRNACFSKRKTSFLKKAAFLSENTGSDIAIIVRRRADPDKPPLLFSSNGDLLDTFAWYFQEQQSLTSVESSLLTRQSSALRQSMQLCTNESVGGAHWNSRAMVLSRPYGSLEPSSAEESKVPPRTLEFRLPEMPLLISPEGVLLASLQASLQIRLHGITE